MRQGEAGSRARGRGRARQGAGRGGKRGRERGEAEAHVILGFRVPTTCYDIIWGKGARGQGRA